MLSPQEGRGLVRARHPGSARIEEFLGQLEGLWEELRRRHQRNAVFLQASGELGFRVKISLKKYPMRFRSYKEESLWI